MNQGGGLRTAEEQLAVDGQRRSYAQGLARPAIDFVCNRVELLLAVAREIGALKQVLAHRPFVFSLLPRCHGLCGSQKYTATPVRSVSLACIAISRPRS